ncbi:hypothetical protein L596_002281 [Steinernema carpocapsae]|uniref:Uncharacterized protein n=1 Tax=Steinernema carpocapsae TaxID=34508 RepID=A0A4V6I7M9_STECR|nr:hypothetical protein L596_002281 [Steinernema carpocapsae]
MGIKATGKEGEAFVLVRFKVSPLEITARGDVVEQTEAGFRKYNVKIMHLLLGKELQTVKHISLDSHCQYGVVLTDYIGHVF